MVHWRDLMRQRRPRIVLLDLMAVMDGFGFRAPATPGTGPRAGAGSPPDRDVRRARVAERLAVPCLNKPVSVDRLLMEVEERCPSQ